MKCATMVSSVSRTDASPVYNSLIMIILSFRHLKTNIVKGGRKRKGSMERKGWKTFTVIHAGGVLPTILKSAFTNMAYHHHRIPNPQSR